ncbi:DMT family transporter, partial [Bordetella bronchiseptica]
AFNPVPGATIRLPGLDDPVMVWRAQALEQGAGGPPGADAGADGYLAALGCAFVWSGYSALNRRYADVPSDMIGGVCGVVALAGGLCHLAFEQTVAPSVAQWWAILGLGIGPVGLAFFAWDYATKRGSLPLLGALSYLAPLVSTLLLIATGAAAAGWGPVLAALAIIGGAWLATRR